jgi:DNA-binding winged helix-turn-helix (wHTH) protein/tetratricopeptide (TPR) repeat protein/TolB-like protein
LQHNAAVAIHVFGAWRINPETRELWRGDERLSVPPRVFDCLVYLIEHRERAVGRDELISAVWGRVDVADVQVSQLIARTRRLLDDDAQAQELIRTISGFGYRWVAQAEPQPTSSSSQSPSSSPPPAAITVAAPGAGADMRAEPPSPAAPPDSPQPSMPASRAAQSSLARRWIIALGLIVFGLLAALLWRLLPGASSLPDRAAASAAIIAVLPFAVQSEADDHAWLRLGAMDLLAHRLRRTGLPVPPSESVVSAQREPGVAEPRRPEAVAAILGADRYVQGRISADEGGWRVQLDVHGGELPSLSVEALRPDPIAAVRQASELLLIRLGHAGHQIDEAGIDLTDLDQRIKAAILAGDQAAASALLDAAPAALKTQPRLRLRRAEFDYHAGRLDASQQQIDALLDEPALEPLIRVRALLARGLLGLRRGDCPEAGLWLDRALESRGEPEQAQELATALTARGMVKACLQQPAEAAADFGLARLRFEAQGDRLGVARVENYLGLFEIDRQRPESALPHLQAALATFDSFGVVDARRAVNTAVIQAHSLLLRWVDAGQAAERLLALRDQVADPTHRQLLDSDRSRVLLARGQLAEARRLIDGAEREAGGEGMATRHLRHSRALLAWQQQNWDELHEVTGSALQGWSRRNEMDRAWLIWARSRAAAARALPVEPVPVVLREQATGIDAALALLALADAVRLQQAGDIDAADQAYRRAVAHADALALASITVLVAGEYGHWLLSRGRLDEAEAMAGRIAGWAGQDYHAALLRLAVYHARGQAGAWRRSLEPLQALAGERSPPDSLLQAP